MYPIKEPIPAAGIQVQPSAPPPPYSDQPGPYVTSGSQVQPGIAGAVYPPPPPYVPSRTQPEPAMAGAVYPPPPPYVTSVMQPQLVTVVTTSVSTTAVVGNTCLSTPACVICPSCHTQVITRITHSAGLLAWLICGGLLLFGFWMGCCLIPFCIDSCLDVNHFCPNCNHLIHKHKRL
ncbi:lipopolysaccharide-induced tumor necrosis factor-alpha factor homolog isoform X2 [Microcaecilia unicolor]|nr:lipopolysaccharide-induced tumor necrosis factor-alpha factor homolog isoform X2 [Microcaecilia unicolor]XP_030068896.1 lipopolysaccharide-induced tumor necrosis factor-alpha factor homolog isoform X2 [Microcaecilia unicolor]